MSATWRCREYTFPLFRLSMQQECALGPYLLRDSTVRSRPPEIELSVLFGQAYFSAGAQRHHALHLDNPFLLLPLCGQNRVCPGNERNRRATWRLRQRAQFASLPREGGVIRLDTWCIITMFPHRDWHESHFLHSKDNRSHLGEFYSFDI